MVQLGSSIRDLGLVGKRWRAVHEHAELHNLLDPIERAEGCFHLGKKHDAATARCFDSTVQVDVLTQTPFDQAAVLGKADLTRDVQDSTVLDRRYVGGNGRSRLRKGDAQFGQALVNAHGLAPSTGADLNQASRFTVKPAKLWLTGISSIVLMLRCGGRLASHQNRSERSSAVIGSMPA